MSDKSPESVHDLLDDIETVRGIANSSVLEADEADAIERVCDAATLHSDAANAPAPSAPRFKTFANVFQGSAIGLSIVDLGTNRAIGTVMLSGSTLSPNERNKIAKDLADLIEGRNLDGTSS
jgi:uncharacterized protein YfkK (UPF0435 family)